MANLSAIITPTNVLTDVSTNTVTNKTISFGSNTLTDVAGTTATQTLSNKTLLAPVSTGTKETRVAMPANDIDLAAGNYFSKTISGATTLTLSNVATTGTVSSFILDLTNGGSAAVTFFANVKFAGGTVPTLTAAGRDVLGFFTHDAGATFSGFVLGKDVK